MDPAYTPILLANPLVDNEVLIVAVVAGALAVIALFVHGSGGRFSGKLFWQVFTVWLGFVMAAYFHGCGRPSSQDPAASPSPQARPSGADNEKTAVDSFKAVANDLAQRYSHKEIQGPKETDSLPLDVVVPRESISVKPTGDLIRPFRGEVRGLATLSQRQEITCTITMKRKACFGAFCAAVPMQNVHFVS